MNKQQFDFLWDYLMGIEREDLAGKIDELSDEDSEALVSLIKRMQSEQCTPLFIAATVVKDVVGMVYKTPHYEPVCRSTRFNTKSLSYE